MSVGRDDHAMTVREAFRAVVADRSWFKKTAIGVGIMMIPYVGTFWFTGYGLAWVRAAAWDPEAQLPEWQPVGPRLRTGLIAFVVSLIYSLPLSALMIGGIFLLIARGAFGLAEMASVWDFVVPLIAFTVGMTLVSVVYGVAIWPVFAQVALYDSIEAGFDLRRIFGRVREHAMAYRSVFWRALAVGLFSSFIVLTGMLVVVGGMVFGAALLLPDEMAGLVWMLVMPAQMVSSVLTGFVSVLAALVSYRLWAGYTRTAYGLDSPASVPDAAV
ncbi:MAG: DUF4013 domain-containing protein [Coriobacteriia bacterium]|nr:DUF4013 domain-containing protein [Coriobacteriia bacterium]